MVSASTERKGNRKEKKIDYKQNTEYSDICWRERRNK